MKRKHKKLKERVFSLPKFFNELLPKLKKVPEDLFLGKAVELSLNGQRASRLVSELTNAAYVYTTTPAAKVATMTLAILAAQVRLVRCRESHPEDRLIADNFQALTNLALRKVIEGALRLDETNKNPQPLQALEMAWSRRASPTDEPPEKHASLMESLEWMFRVHAQDRRRHESESIDPKAVLREWRLQRNTIEHPDRAEQLEAACHAEAVQAFGEWSHGHAGQAEQVFRDSLVYVVGCGMEAGRRIAEHALRSKRVIVQ